MPINSNNFSLSDSVGQGGRNNPSDVLAVKNRLADLGFPVTRDSNIDSDTIAIIKLFQSIIKGEVQIRGDGLVEVNKQTHKFLQAANAPKWIEMPSGSPAEGYLNFDNIQVETGSQSDDHDFGTNWMVETIQAAAQIYLNDYLASHPSAALIQTNDLSLPRGGNTSEHVTHETGLSCDIRLPRKDGQSGGGITVSDSIYDREAMRAMLKAIRGQTKNKIRRIFLNDFSLVTEGLCQQADGHHNHAHIDIIPPDRQ
jgi:hypothetical protein